MAKVHTERWFAKQERLLNNEPFKNTRKYYCHVLRFFTRMFIFPTVTALQYARYRNLCLKQSEDYIGKSRAVTLTGEPGVGKTFSATSIAIAIAGRRWEALKSDYLLQSAMINRWIEEGDVEKITSFRSLEESYFFYKEREAIGIPCLVSSIPLRDRCGRFSYQLTPEVPLQLVRLPEYTVIFNDESGLTQGAKTSRNASSDIKDFYRFNRHFGDFLLLNTEQGDDQNAKYIRIVTDHNIRLRRQEWIMKPTAAPWKLEKQKAKFFKKQAQGKYSPERERYLAEKYYYREKYLKTIGFRAIPYHVTQSEGSGLDGENGIYYFPACGMAEYDDRAFRNLYQSKDKLLNVPIYHSLLVDSNPHDFDEQIVS